MKPGCALVATFASLAGCVYTETDLDFPSDGSPNPIAVGYWQVCGVFASKAEECHVLRSERGAVGGGVFHGTAGVVSVYAVRSLTNGSFVYQTRLKTNMKTAFFYALGSRDSDGSITLSSPDCRFSREVDLELAAAGLSMPLTIPFLPRSCAVRNASADAIVLQFAILAKHRNWQSDASRTLMRMSDADGSIAFDAERSATQPAADEGTNKTGAEARMVALMEQAVDARFTRWSSSWRIDHYTADSARVTRLGCGDGGCSTSGRFTFGRQGIAYRIPFNASFARRDGGLVLDRLCYDDTSSGSSDCVR